MEDISLIQTKSASASKKFYSRLASTKQSKQRVFLRAVFRNENLENQKHKLSFSIIHKMENRLLCCVEFHLIEDWYNKMPKYYMFKFNENIDKQSLHAIVNQILQETGIKLKKDTVNQEIEMVFDN